jgi:hypothetical protein
MTKAFTLPRSPWTNKALLRLAVVLTTLAACALLAHFGSVQLAALIALGIAGMAVLAILMRAPSFGLLAIVAASFLAPLRLGTGTESSINAPMMVIGLLLVTWLIAAFVRRERIRLVRSRPMLPLLAFVTIAVAALVVGQLPWFPFSRTAPLAAQLGGLGLFLLSAMVFFLTAQLIRDIRWLERLTWLFLALGTVYIVSRHIPELRPHVRRLFQYGSTSSQFWTWMVTLAAGQAIFNRRMSPPRRALLLVLGLFCLFTAYSLEGWKSGWMPAAVALGVLVTLRAWPAGLVVLAAGLVIGPNLSQSLIASDEYSFVTRIAAWLSLTEIIKVNPILGLGPANYYWYTPSVQILGYRNIQFNSHNQYVDLVAQLGFLGLGAFLWFAAEVARLGWQLRSHVPDGFAQGYVHAALAGLAATLFAGMLGDWVLPFVYNVGFVGFRASLFGWLFLGGLVALEQIYVTAPDSGRNQQAQPASRLQAGGRASVRDQ